MAICGDSCSVTVGGGATFEGHRYVITVNAPDIDVRTFSSGEYGSWLTCVKDGTVDIETYLPIPSIQAGSTADLVCTIASNPIKLLTASDTRCTNITVNVDSKDVVTFSYSFKLTGDITGW